MEFSTLFKHYFAILLSTNAVYAAGSDKAQSSAKINGKILVVMTNHSAYPSRSDKTGLWLTELTHFMMLHQRWL